MSADLPIRYLPSPSEVDRLSTNEIRRQFLLEDLFAPGEARLVHTGLDRIVAGGILPASELRLEAPTEFRSAFFHERRETGVINIGAPGEVIVDGRSYCLDRLGCLYIGRGAEEVLFRNADGDQSAYYLLSCPAHRSYPVKTAALHQAETEELGSSQHASCRRIVRYIHERGIQSCQLVMGFTELRPGSIWNTWPPHTHSRRSEIYLYFDLQGDLVMHFLGTPEQSRNLVVRERQAVLAPPWSIHCGVGTGSYRFIWGMAGENQTFADMDPADLGAFK